MTTSKETAAAAAASTHLVLPQKRPGIRRVSSTTATDAELKGEVPFTIAPASTLGDLPTAAHETAAQLELAKHRLAQRAGVNTPGTPPSPTETSVTDSYAYAFDIDGVLIKGGDVIPEAIEAMKVLNGDNEYGVKVPYIFVTNGGGKTEAERCLQLSKQLELEISPGQFICGHTPMREMAEKYKTVLVVGGEGDKCRKVAEGYGFKDVITPGDIILDNSATTPFRQLTEDEKAHSRRRVMSETEIEAIFVFADSRDWAGDQQIILDVLMSKNGRLGTRGSNFDEGPPIFFSHNDIVWATSHEYTRLGMGALRTSIEALYKGLTGRPLKSVAFGKPQIGTFDFATRLLQQWRKDTHGINSPPDTVYFVGDTPGSDIRGTNEYNDSKTADADWYSILVETGVYDKGTEPDFIPRTIVPNVLDAVKHGMQREFNKQIQAAKGQIPIITRDPIASDLKQAAKVLVEDAPPEDASAVA